MFNTLIVRAKSVRPGNIIKIAGKKYVVGTVATSHGMHSVTIYFYASSDASRSGSLTLDKNEPIKIHSK